MISSLITRASAAFLLLGGLLLLFASDVVLPSLIPGFPPAGRWLGQLLAAAWLALASLNWINREALLGGIYARPVVLANALCYFIGATALLRAATRQPPPGPFWFLAAPVVAFAGVYGWLLFRGPLERDVGHYRGSREATP